MKISQHIQVLEAIQSEQGDLDVETDHLYGRGEAATPRISHRMILRGRESKPRFASSYDDESKRGEPVCKV